MERSFGERLKGCRQSKGLTQQALADLLGVSNKTVSRWEADGGYPDVPLLVPLARALGVVVDDLLDGEKPIRALGRADWQNLLSFGFALGGGVLFFLLRLFVPGALCYLGYLGCLAYGVYLQRYYAYQSRWFFLGEAVVNLGVNGTICLELMAAVATLGSFYDGPDSLVWLAQNRAWDVLLILFGVAGLLALALTGLTQYMIRQWYGQGGTSSLGWRLKRRPLSVRALLPLAIPVATVGFWLAYGKEAAALPPWAYRHQFILFMALIGVGALLCLLLFGKKGRRGMLFPSLGLVALCALQYPLGRPLYVFAVQEGQLISYEWGLPGAYYIPFFSHQVEQILGFVILTAALYLVCVLVEVEKKPKA